MVINPDPIKILIERHIGLLDDLYLLRTTIDRLLKQSSPHLVEGLKREFLSFLKTMEQHMRCEEGVLFPVLKSSLGSKSAPIISMSGEHTDLKEGMNRLRTIITNLETEDKEKSIEAIKSADEEIDSLIDLFSRHIDKEEKCLFKLAREVLEEKELAEIEEKMKKIEME
ncbi:MAG: hemerythrin domain-containing protein [Thermodesulfobacteriota bacterium]